MQYNVEVVVDDLELKFDPQKYDIPEEWETFLTTLSLDTTERGGRNVNFSSNLFGLSTFLRQEEVWTKWRQRLLNVSTRSRYFKIKPWSIGRFKSKIDFSMEKIAESVILEDLHRAVNVMGSSFCILTVSYYALPVFANLLNHNAPTPVLSYTSIIDVLSKLGIGINSQSIGIMEQILRSIKSLDRHVICGRKLQRLQERESTAFDWNKIEVVKRHVDQHSLKHEWLCEAFPDQLTVEKGDSLFEKSKFIYIFFEKAIWFSVKFSIERQAREMLKEGRVTAVRIFDSDVYHDVS